MKVVVETNRFTGLSTLVTKLNSPALQQGAARGLNEHVRLQERQAVRLLSSQTRVPTGHVGSVTRPIMAHGGGGSLEASVQVKDRPLELGEKTSRSWSRGSAGAVASDWKTRTYPGAFTIAKRGGAIYVRTTKKRFPIAKLWGPVLPNELRRRDQPTLPAAERLARSDLEPRVLRHITRALG